ncbi:hypothetical protein P7C73_g5542, partial [Tremellales sp. Uapishka_1]
MSVNVKETIVLITGANKGNGYGRSKLLFHLQLSQAEETLRLATAVALLKSSHPYLILVGARSAAKAETAIEQLKQSVTLTKSSLAPIVVDLYSDDSIAKLGKDIAAHYGRLDVLVNNAGQNLDTDTSLSTREVFQKTFDVNITGQHILTQTLVPYLLKSSAPRLIFVSSDVGTFDETTIQGHPMNAELPAGWPKPYSYEVPAYRSSKTALNMIMLDWFRILRNDHVKVWCVAPGFLATDLGGHKDYSASTGALDPSVGGERVKAVVEGEWDEHTGRLVGSQVFAW